MLHPNFVILAAFISSIGVLSYLIDTIKGRVKPNKVSFLMWSIAPLIAFAAQIQKGGGIEALMTFVSGFFPLLVFFASFFNKEAAWKITKFDLWCGSMSFVGLILWFITKEANLAIAFSIMADGWAAVPTYIKSFKYPETEAAWPYFSTTIGTIITLLTIRQPTFANTGFVVYLFFMTLTISILIRFKLGKRFAKTSVSA